MTELATLLDMSAGVLWLHFVIFLRVAPAIALFPGFGEQTVPVRIKLGLAVMMTLITAPAVAPSLRTVQQGEVAMGWVTLTEAAVGLLIGLGIRLFVLALQTAGTIAAQSTSLAQIVGSAGIEPMPAIGHVLILGGIALAMMLGLHVRLAEMLILTYALFPAAQIPDAGAISTWGVRQVAAAFALALALAAPFVIVSILYNLTLGVINRAMPQMMVVFVGAPVITGAGIALLLIMGPTILSLWVEALGDFMANPFEGL